MEVRHLRAFAAVAENLSFTAAGRQLLVAQSALTRTIQQLEQVLEVTLLERSSRSVRLTEAGHAFLARTRSVLRDLDVAVAQVRGERELRVGFAWVLPDPWAGDLVSAFEETTGAAARLMRRDDLESALDRGDVDVAIARHRIASESATTLTLFEEQRVAAVSRRSRLAGRDRFTWNELAEHPVVINADSGSTQPDLWDAEHRPARVVECGNYDEWVALVAAGRGVGATALSAAYANAPAGIEFVPLENAPPAALRLAWVPSRAGALLRRFVEAAIAQGRPRLR